MPQRRSMAFYMAFLLAGLAAGFSPQFAAAAVPVVATFAASGQSNTVAQLNGTVNPNGLEAAGWFEWGTSTFDYSQRTAPVELGNGTVAVGLSNRLDGLTPGVIYHGRIVATNADGLSPGGDVAFGSPQVVLNGVATLTNALGSAYVEPGAVATGAILALSGGGSHSLALRSDGTVMGWGHDDFDQTSIPAGLDNVVAIAAGAFHSLALRRDGTVAGWGNNDGGQTAIPDGLSNVVAIAAGGFHSLGLRSDGTVVSWGFNRDGQTTIPAGLSNVVAIAAGVYHSLALRLDGTVVGWGGNFADQTTIPAGLSNVVAIACGDSHSLALRRDGTAAAWGYIGLGQTTIPPGLSNVVAIAAGAHFDLMLGSDGTVSAVGNSIYGATVPAGLSNVVAIAAGGLHGLALRSDGTVAVWGSQAVGYTDLPADLNRLPVAVSGSVDANTPGRYLLTYTSTNALGGLGTVIRKVVVVPPAFPPVLTRPSLNRLRNGAFQFSFINATGLLFQVWGSPDPALPLGQWSDLGQAVETPSGSGLYQYSAPVAPSNPSGFFYRVSSP